MSFDSEQSFASADDRAEYRPRRVRKKASVSEPDKAYVPRHAINHQPDENLSAGIDFSLDDNSAVPGGLHVEHSGVGAVNTASPRKKDNVPKLTDSKGGKGGKGVNVVTLAAVLVIIVCVVVLAKYFYEIYEAKKNHDSLRNLYADMAKKAATMTTTEAKTETEKKVEETLSSDMEGTQTTVETEPVVTEITHAPRDIMPAAAALLAENPDTVGYIQIPGCVDEPVVKGTDNEYYLTHNFYNQQRSCGTCFADYRSVVGDWERSDNITLYAHNQRDGTMFGELDRYTYDYHYWLKNPFVYFNTNYSEDVYVIVSSFVINIEPSVDNGRKVFDYQNYVNFTDSGDYSFDHFYSEIMKRTQFLTDIDCNENDQYLTLSTCSYEWDEARHVMVARKLREGESTETFDTTNFRKNPNPKWPYIYYKYNGGTYIDEDEVQ